MKWAEHLQKERNRDKLRRERMKEKISGNVRMIEENRRKIKKRVREHRNKIKVSKTNPLSQHESPIGTVASHSERR